MFVDYVLNGQSHGEVGNIMSAIRFDPGLKRPYIDDRGQNCVTVNTGRARYDDALGQMVPIFEKRLVAEFVHKGVMAPVNNATTLRKDEWKMFDQVVLKATRQRLRAWGDIASRNSFSINGMSKMILEHERMTDVGEAQVDMDGISEGNSDTPLVQLEGLPLPITHSGFTFSARQIAISRNVGNSLDATMAEMAGRRIAEKIEKTLIGVTTGISYGVSTPYDNTPTVYGYTNHPDRITSSGGVTTPTSTNQATTLAEVLAIIDLAKAKNFFGPYMLYTTNDWDQFMDNDYAVGAPAAGLAAPSLTLRERLRKIDDIIDVRRLDFWTDTTALLLVQMTSDVVRAVNGMDVTTVQWESKGGMQLNFKVMAIMVPQIRSQFIGTDQTNAAARCGIVHATV